jgi:hypothetical protein
MILAEHASRMRPAVILAAALLLAKCGAPQTPGARTSTQVTVTNRQDVAASVWMTFGADSVVRPSDWCDGDPCFHLDAGESKALPNPGGRYANVTIAFNSPVGCGSTKAELNLNNPRWYDVVDVSLVDGFNEIVALVLTPSSGEPTTIQPNGPTGNQRVLGLYPLGCDICVARQNPPCDIPLGNQECKSGSQSAPDVPCQVQGTPLGGGGQSVEVVLR